MKPSENDINNTEVLPYLLFTVGNNIYGINCEFVRSIETLGEYTTIADADPIVRGGIIYQNHFISLFDMRKIFGLDSQIEEFEKAVQPDQRIKDHENWVSALEKSVRERTDFMLTDDPHQCAFGKWFYSFTTDNNLLMLQIKAIEAPHEAVHNTAKIIKKLMRENKYEQAADAIEEMKATHYKTTLNLLRSLRKTVAENLKELYIVIDSHAGMKGIIVDTIVGVEYLENTLSASSSARLPQYVEFLGQRKNDDRIVIVLNNTI